ALLRTDDGNGTGRASRLRIRTTVVAGGDDANRLRDQDGAVVARGSVDHERVTPDQTGRRSPDAGQRAPTSWTRWVTADSTAISCRSPLRRSFTSITPFARPRPTTTIVGTPISSASVNLTPGVALRSSSRTRTPAASRSAASRSAPATISSVLPAITTWTS